ncbi:phage terminase large subunit family protein [Brevundimonas vancanneytii]|uniref:phage terminase large subunit family protein n=1 Tax=Brevundimonas vancanneytii TaxID=1325724 RepID=UPI0034D7366F
MSGLDRIRAAALRQLAPPQSMNLAEWMEAEMRLPEGVSATPGRIRLWPPQRGIAEAISDPAIERVTLMKPVRVGLSTLVSATVASHIANDPAPILVLLPTQDDCRDFVVSDLEPICEATPSCAGLLSGEGDEGGRNTILSRRFAGGSLKVVAAKAPRNLRRHNVRILLMDEIDAMEGTAEGNPLFLAERRTLSFANRKIIAGSTPTDEATSNVARLYAQSDQRVFEVPCPECGAFTEIQWGHLRWAEGRPETVAFQCPHCEKLISEKHKPQMVAAGAWRSTRPEVRGHAGFRLNALVSTLANAAWPKLVAEFLAVKDRPDELQTFVNTILAETWSQDGEALDGDSLAGHAEDFALDQVPAEVIYLTVGVDVQHDRLELVYLGHDADGLPYVLGAEVINGRTDDDATWGALDDLLRQTWAHPLGGRIGVDAALIDSGDGATTEQVYAFARPRIGRRVFACKGVGGFKRVPLERSSTVKGVALQLVGVDTLKKSLARRLQQVGQIRFSRSLSARFYDELTSERRVVRYVRGTQVERFDRIPGKRAEALDCVVYAMAARSLVTTPTERQIERLTTQAAPTAAMKRRASQGRSQGPFAHGFGPARFD